MAQDIENELEKIARKFCFVNTLKTQNSDDLDFHDISAASLKAALLAAYEAGKNEGGA